MDQYTFQGQSGRWATLSLANVGGWPSFTTAVATLFAPSGAVVVSFGANDQRQVALPATGIYVVQVRANNFATTGRYNLGLECRNPAEIVNGTLTCGGLPLGGAIVEEAQVDQYTFARQASGSVTLTLANIGNWPSFTTAVATLFAPSGQAVTGGGFSATGQRQVTLSETGTHVVQVRANNLVTTGQYSIALQCPIAVCDQHAAGLVRHAWDYEPRSRQAREAGRSDRGK